MTEKNRQYRDNEYSEEEKKGLQNRISDFMLNLLFCVLSEALGGVKNLQVTDPSTSSLKVRWEPAEGNVRQYRLFYVPASGGAEDMVRPPTICALTSDTVQGIS